MIDEDVCLNKEFLICNSTIVRQNMETRPYICHIHVCTRCHYTLKQQNIAHLAKSSISDSVDRVPLSLLCPNEIVQRFSAEHTNRNNLFLSEKNLCIDIFGFPLTEASDQKHHVCYWNQQPRDNSSLAPRVLSLPPVFLEGGRPWTLGTSLSK